MKCCKCGRMIADDATFCPNCGAKQVISNATTSNNWFGQAGDLSGTSAPKEKAKTFDSFAGSKIEPKATFGTLHNATKESERGFSVVEENIEKRTARAMRIGFSKLDKILFIVSIVVALIGIIVAFSTTELLESEIYYSKYSVFSGIWGHALLVFTLILVADILIAVASRNIAKQPSVSGLCYAFYGTCAVFGLLFGIATAQKQAANSILSVYNGLSDDPAFYRDSVVEAMGGYGVFNSMPSRAQEFSDTVIVMFLLTVVAVLALVAIAVVIYKNNRKV